MGQEVLDLSRKPNYPNAAFEEAQGIGFTSQRTRDRLIARLAERGLPANVLKAMRVLPRHLFINEALANRAYEDTALPIGYGQTISQPLIVAQMTAWVSAGLGELPLERGVIITGDLDSRFERHLVDKYAENLQVDLLVAGHHGSKYSTSQEFLAAINPQIVLFSSGWLNRFGFPTKEAISRVEEQAAEWFNAACSGAITFRINQDGVELINQQRITAKKWFHNECYL